MQNNFIFNIFLLNCLTTNNGMTNNYKEREILINKIFVFFKEKEFYIKYKNTNEYYEENNKFLLKQQINYEYWKKRGYDYFFLLPFVGEKLNFEDFYPRFEFIHNITEQKNIEKSIKNINIILEKLTEIQNTFKDCEISFHKIDNLIASWKKYKKEVNQLKIH